MVRHTATVLPHYRAVLALGIWVSGSQSQDITQDPTTYTSGSDDDDDDNDDDDCSMISGHSCAANGVCKYCVMCIQSSCIMTKSTGTGPTCNTTQFGIEAYEWYNYCLSSGNDNDGDYCATSSECYQYRKDANASVSHIWQNLTCDPMNCLLMTDHLRPPFPGQLPPTTTPSDTTRQPSSAGSVGSHRTHHRGLDIAGHSPVTVALTVTCSFLLVVCIVWVIRMCCTSKHTSVWMPCLPRQRRRPQSLTSATSTVPSTAPPSFRSMIQRRRHSRLSSSLHSTPSITEPLPSYYTPDPPPPKYEQAIVSQIRGLQPDQPSDLSTNDHVNGLPPALWLPVYYSPHHSSFLFGRQRNQLPTSPPFPSSSSNAAWQHHGDLTDPIRAFWLHHQQHITQRQHPFSNSVQHGTSSPGDTNDANDTVGSSRLVTPTTAPVADASGVNVSHPA